MLIEIDLKELTKNDYEVKDDEEFENPNVRVIRRQPAESKDVTEKHE